MPRHIIAHNIVRCYHIVVLTLRSLLGAKTYVCLSYCCGLFIVLAYV